MHSAQRKREKKTLFPIWWTQEDVIEAVKDVQLYGKATQVDDTGVTYQGYTRGILIHVWVRNGEIGSAYPLRDEGVERFFKAGNEAVPLLISDKTDYPDIYGHRFSLRRSE